MITVSRHAANCINSVFINKILQKLTLLGHATSDCELGKIPVFKGMRVIITQNQNKALSIVNGRIGTVVALERNTLFLKLCNGHIVHIHPVSFQHQNETVKTAMPFMPAYALTIPKAQGQMLEKCTVWLDSPVLECVGHSSIRFFQKLKITFNFQFSTFQFVNIYKNKFRTLIFVFL